MYFFINRWFGWLGGSSALQSTFQIYAPRFAFFNTNLHVFASYRVEEMINPLMQKIRYMDKLIDELAKGKAMEKILRE